MNRKQITKDEIKVVVYHWVLNDLTLPALAQKLGISVHRVKRIRQHLGLNARERNDVLKPLILRQHIEFGRTRYDISKMFRVEWRIVDQIISTHEEVQRVDYAKPRTIS